MAALEGWKEKSIPHLDEMRHQTTSFQDMLRDFPQWKKKVDATHKTHVSRFDSFLDIELQPMKSQFDEMLEEWQCPEKRQRSEDFVRILVPSDDDEEEDLNDPHSNGIPLNMATGSGACVPPETPEKSKKPRADKERSESSELWLQIPP